MSLSDNQHKVFLSTLHSHIESSILHLVAFGSQMSYYFVNMQFHSLFQGT